MKREEGRINPMQRFVVEALVTFVLLAAIVLCEYALRGLITMSFGTGMLVIIGAILLVATLFEVTDPTLLKRFYLGDTVLEIMFRSLVAILPTVVFWEVARAVRGLSHEEALKNLPILVGSHLTLFLGLVVPLYYRRRQEQRVRKLGEN